MTVPRRFHVSQHAAHRAAQRAHRWHPAYYGRRRVYLPPRRGIAAAGRVFAFVQRVTYVVETQRPEPGLHVEADHHDPIAAGTEILLVFLVIVIAGWVLI